MSRSAMRDFAKRSVAEIVGSSWSELDECAAAMLAAVARLNVDEVLPKIDHARLAPVFSDALSLEDLVGDEAAATIKAVDMPRRLASLAMAADQPCWVELTKIATESPLPDALHAVAAKRDVERALGSPESCNGGVPKSLKSLTILIERSDLSLGWSLTAPIFRRLFAEERISLVAMLQSGVAIETADQLSRLAAPRSNVICLFGSDFGKTINAGVTPGTIDPATFCFLWDGTRWATSLSAPELSPEATDAIEPRLLVDGRPRPAMGGQRLPWIAGAAAVGAYFDASLYDGLGRSMHDAHGAGDGVRSDADRVAARRRSMAGQLNALRLSDAAAASIRPSRTWVTGRPEVDPHVAASIRQEADAAAEERHPFSSAVARALAITDRLHRERDALLRRCLDQHQLLLFEVVDGRARWLPGSSVLDETEQDAHGNHGPLIGLDRRACPSLASAPHEPVLAPPHPAPQRPKRGRPPGSGYSKADLPFVLEAIAEMSQNDRLVWSKAVATIVERYEAEIDGSSHSRKIDRLRQFIGAEDAQEAALRPEVEREAFVRLAHATRRAASKDARARRPPTSISNP